MDKKYGVVTDAGYDSGVMWFDELEDAIDHYQSIGGCSPTHFIVEKISIQTVFQTKSGEKTVIINQ